MILIVKIKVIHAKYSSSQQDLITQQKIVDLCDETVTILSNNQIEHYYSDYIKLGKNIILTTENNKKIRLASIINKPTLVLRYSEFVCQSCVDNQIELLKKFGEETGEQNVLIISTYDEIRNLIIFKRANQLNMDIYNIEKLKIPLDSENIPYYFVIDESFTIKHVFIPNNGIVSLTEKYLDFIWNRYFSKK